LFVRGEKGGHREKSHLIEKKAKWQGVEKEWASVKACLGFPKRKAGRSIPASTLGGEYKFLRVGGGARSGGLLGGGD